jgi:hypothetical protein
MLAKAKVSAITNLFSLKSNATGDSQMEDVMVHVSFTRANVLTAIITAEYTNNLPNTHGICSAKNSKWWKKQFFKGK